MARRIRKNLLSPLRELSPTVKHVLKNSREADPTKRLAIARLATMRLVVAQEGVSFKARRPVTQLLEGRFRLENLQQMAIHRKKIPREAAVELLENAAANWKLVLQNAGNLQMNKKMVQDKIDFCEKQLKQRAQNPNEALVLVPDKLILNAFEANTLSIENWVSPAIRQRIIERTSKLNRRLRPLFVKELPERPK